MSGSERVLYQGDFDGSGIRIRIGRFHLVVLFGFNSRYQDTGK